VREGRARSSILGRLIPVVLVVALGVYGYTAYSGKRAQAAEGGCGRSARSTARARLPAVPVRRSYATARRCHPAMSEVFPAQLPQHADGLATATAFLVSSSGAQGLVEDAARGIARVQ